MRVLAACEESQAVTKSFRKRGHEAFSCDILPCSGGFPEWHIQCDVLPILAEKWDLIIAFPPCRYLTVSANGPINNGCSKYTKEEAVSLRANAIKFFLTFTKLKVPFCIENPIGIMSTRYRKPDQIIQPWMFGHGETKATCLWLSGLPKLIPTNIVEGREQRIIKMSPSPERAKMRAKTFQGIADAMAEQWGK